MTLGSVTKQPVSRDLHNSFGLLQDERILNQWESKECASACCGAVNYTTVTDQRVLTRRDGCTVFSCLCGCCVDRPFEDKSVFLHHIADLETASMSCYEKLLFWFRCSCPQDGIYLYGSFGGISCFPFSSGYRTVFLSSEDKIMAQQVISTAVANASRRH